jgi:hypothetical protein
MGGLSAEEIDRFVADGYLHLAGAFSRELAAACVEELWAELPGLDRHDPGTWTEPVVRIGGSAAPALVAAINTDRLVGAIDQLVGVGRWQRRTGYGTFPVRFPSEQDPGDAGWHVDGSFEVAGLASPDNLWVNLASTDRALLVLMLYSDVGPDDAPTRMRVGSHVDVARALATFDDRGGSFASVTAAAIDSSSRRAVVEAVGSAGDAYLCHPFLMHSATWPHRGSGPRFMAQPCIYQSSAGNGFDYRRPKCRSSPCEVAVQQALGITGAGYSS